MSASLPTKARNTVREGSVLFARKNYDAAAQTFWSGHMVNIATDDGYAKHVSGSAAATVWTVIGVANQDKAVATAGADTIEVSFGTFPFVSDTGANECRRHDIGHPVYQVDSQTVSRTSKGGTLPVAGLLESVVTGSTGVAAFVTITPIGGWTVSGSLTALP